MNRALLPLVLGLAPLACGSPDQRDAPRPFSAVIERLDADGSGALEPQEYMPFAYGAPPYEDVDIDGDGALDHDELATLARILDPWSFDGRNFGLPPLPTISQGGKQPTQSECKRQLDHLFGFLLVEVRAKDPGYQGPSEEHRNDAITTASLDDPAVQAILAELAAAYRTHGMAFPPGLLEGGE